MSSKKESKRSDEYKSVFGNDSGNTGMPGGDVDWCNAAPNSITLLIDAVTSRGGAIRFGYTRDGGAYACGFYYGSESVTKYCRPSENLEEFLDYWTKFYNALPNTGGKSPQQ